MIKKPEPKQRASQPLWERVEGLPLRMFQTVAGPIMGHVEKETAKGIRIWAPAQVAMPNPLTVFFMPIAFCEQYFDAFWTGVRGTNEIPEVIAQGYAGYFKNFVAGGYNMAPVTINVGIEGKAHVIDGTAS